MAAKRLTGINNLSDDIEIIDLDSASALNAVQKVKKINVRPAKTSDVLRSDYDGEAGAPNKNSRVPILVKVDGSVKTEGRSLESDVVGRTAWNESTETAKGSKKSCRKGSKKKNGGEGKKRRGEKKNAKCRDDGDVTSERNAQKGESTDDEPTPSCFSAFAARFTGLKQWFLLKLGRTVSIGQTSSMTSMSPQVGSRPQSALENSFKTPKSSQDSGVGNDAGKWTNRNAPSYSGKLDGHATNIVNKSSIIDGRKSLSYKLEFEVSKPVKEPPTYLSLLKRRPVMPLTAYALNDKIKRAEERRRKVEEEKSAKAAAMSKRLSADIVEEDGDTAIPRAEMERKKMEAERERRDYCEQLRNRIQEQKRTQEINNKDDIFS